MSEIPKGLPAALPDGERILWQGAPSPASFVRQIIPTPLLVTYVAGLLAWCIATGVSTGQLADAVHNCLVFGGLSAVALALMAGIAWLQARGTTYTITTARVVIDFGIAFEKAVNLPFSVVDAAALAEHGDGTGEIALKLTPGNSVPRLMLWPHLRPWHFGKAQPALRAITQASAVAQILGRALAAAAGTTPAVLHSAPAQTAQDKRVAA